jgi:hypothetical protein
VDTNAVEMAGATVELARKATVELAKKFASFQVRHPPSPSLVQAQVRHFENVAQPYQVRQAHVTTERQCSTPTMTVQNHQINTTTTPATTSLN